MIRKEIFKILDDYGNANKDMEADLLELFEKTALEIIDLKKDGNQEHDFWLQYFSEELRAHLQEVLKK